MSSSHKIMAGGEPDPKTENIPTGEYKTTIGRQMLTPEALNRMGIVKGNAKDAINLFNKTKFAYPEEIQGTTWGGSYKYADNGEYLKNPLIQLNLKRSKEDIKRITGHEATHAFMNRFLPLDYENLKQKQNKYLPSDAFDRFYNFVKDKFGWDKEKAKNMFDNYYTSYSEGSAERNARRLLRGGDFWKEWTKEDNQKYRNKNDEIREFILKMMGEENEIKNMNELVKNNFDYNKIFSNLT